MLSDHKEEVFQWFSERTKVPDDDETEDEEEEEEEEEEDVGQDEQMKQ